MGIVIKVIRVSYNKEVKVKKFYFDENRNLSGGQNGKEC